jgi:PAS domain S-box-containing protein
MFWPEALVSVWAGAIEPVASTGQVGAPFDTALVWISLALSATALAVVAWQSMRRFRSAPDQASARAGRILEEIPGAILLLDPQGRILWASGSTRRLFGGALEGVSVFRFAPPEDQPRAAEQFAELLERPGGLASMEFRFENGPGGHATRAWTARDLRGTPGIDGILLVSRDPAPAPVVGQVASDAAPGGERRRPRVLVAEDDRTNQVVIRKQLEGLGCDPVIAEDGAAALAEWERDVFEMVLLDCQMPVMDGFATAREIRRLERERDKTRSPILAVTAWSMYDDQQLCLQSGMDEVLTKPLRPEVLADALGRWLGYTRA